MTGNALEDVEKTRVPDVITREERGNLGVFRYENPAR